MDQRVYLLTLKFRRYKMYSTRNLFTIVTTSNVEGVHNSLHFFGCKIQKRHFNFKLEKRKEYHGRKLVGFSAQQMYDVVSDVQNYKKFVPFCQQSNVIFRSRDLLRAELQIGFPPIWESYTSEVELFEPYLVKAVCKDGRLFSYLETCWKFSHGLKSNQQTCIIDFSIDFAFKSRLHYQLANMFFEALVKQMESAFLLEAKKRYGLESLPAQKLAYVKS